MRSDPSMKALEEIRDWAARGEARGIGQRAGLELPEDADFVALAEETPGVEPEPQLPPPAENADELENGSVSPEQLEQLLALLASEG